MHIKKQTPVEILLALQLLNGKDVKIQKLKPSKRIGVRLDKVSSQSLGFVKDKSLANRLRMNGVLK